MPSLRSLLLCCCALLAQGDDVPRQLEAYHFAGNAGRFNRHPVAGHKFAMVLFYDADTSPVVRAEFDIVARSVDKQEAAKSQLMVGQFDGDLERNKDTLKNFNIKKLPFIAWLTRGDENWEHRRLSSAPTLLGGINKDLGTELDMAEEEIKVHEMNAGNFRGHAGKFTQHPVKNHYFAAVLFYDLKTNEDELENYQVAARAIARSSVGSKVMLGQLYTEEERNKVMMERFQIKELPFLAWLEKGKQTWGMIAERGAEELVALINRTVVEAKSKFEAKPKHDEM